MTGHATRLAFLLACAGLLGGCPPADGPTYPAPTRHKAAQTRLAVLSAVRWADVARRLQPEFRLNAAQQRDQEIGRASGMGRVCLSVMISVCFVALQNTEYTI